MSPCGSRYDAAVFGGRTVAPTMSELGIDRLPPEERRALAEEILRSLEPERLTPEQQAELFRRDAELDEHPERALTWEQIRTAVERR
jgi:putative addiction module component (TIGR02574 family)